MIWEVFHCFFLTCFFLIFSLFSFWDSLYRYVGMFDIAPVVSETLIKLSLIIFVPAPQFHWTIFFNFIDSSAISHLLLNTSSVFIIVFFNSKNYIWFFLTNKTGLSFDLFFLSSCGVFWFWFWFGQGQGVTCLDLSCRISLPSWATTNVSHQLFYSYLHF